MKHHMHNKNIFTSTKHTTEHCVKTHTQLENATYIFEIKYIMIPYYTQSALSRVFVLYHCQVATIWEGRATTTSRQIENQEQRIRNYCLHAKNRTGKKIINIF